MSLSKITLVSLLVFYAIEHLKSARHAHYLLHVVTKKRTHIWPVFRASYKSSWFTTPPLKQNNKFTHLFKTNK